MIKINPDQKKTIEKKFDKSKGTTSFKKTIVAGKLDGAFTNFDEKFEFVYEPKGSDHGWHPSGDCLPPVSVLNQKARISLGLEKGESKNLSHLNKIFMVGHYWHQIIQYLMVKEGWADPEAIEGIAYRTWDDEGSYTYTVGVPDFYHEDLPILDNESSAAPYHYVRGQGDVAPLVMDGWTGLVDIKTMNPSDFKAGLAQSRFANKYLAQINIYMDLFNLEQAMILAVDKGSSAFQEYTFVRDQKLIDQVYDKWEFVSQCLEHDIIPTAEDDKQFQLYIGDE